VTAAPTSQLSRADARALGSPTTLRFVLLLLLFVAGSAALSGGIAAEFADPADNTLGCALAGGLNPDVTFRFDAFTGIDDAAVRACWAHYVPDTTWVPIVVVPTLILLAVGLYLVLPRWKTRRSRLLAPAQVDLDGRLCADLDALVAEAGLRRRVRIGVDPGALTAGAVVFGTGRHPVLRLHSGLLVTRLTDRRRFRAIVLHELAHIRNGDVLVTYATVALWRVFLAAALVPSAVLAVYNLVTGRSPAAWHLSSLPAYQLIEVALIVVLVYLSRADILRTREMHADLTAVQRWDVRPAELVHEHAPTGRRAFWELWRTHPSWSLRRRTLVAPDALFSLNASAMFATGLIADIFAGQLYSLAEGPSLIYQALSTAAVVVAIAGVSLWRAVRYAQAKGKRPPSGWGTGFWLGAGLAVGELVIAGVLGGGWLPPHPEVLAILIAVVMLLAAWTAEYVRLPVRAMVVGLVPPWLALAFVLTWWRLLTPVEGLLASGTNVLSGLGVSTTHPPLLVEITATLVSLPGADTSFGGLWWAIPLLWLVPLVRWEPLGPRRIVRASLVGGLAAAAGLFAARFAIADAAAELSLLVIVITAAMLGTAAVVGARSATYPLLTASIASGGVALVATLCVSSVFPFSLLEFSTGYVFGPAGIACLGAAALAHAVRPRHGVRVPTTVRRPRTVVAIVVSVTIAVLAVDTGHGTAQARRPVTASVVRAAPEPSARTLELQVDAWVRFGGGNLIERIDAIGDTTFQNAIAEAGSTSDPAGTLSAACARLGSLTDDADRLFPVPIAQGRRIWARIVDALDSAATACGRVRRQHDLTSFLAADDDVQNAESEVDTLLGWMGPVGVPPGTKPVVVSLGEYQSLVYRGVTYRFAAADVSVRPDRTATVNVAVCLAGAPPHVTVVGGPPSAQSWRLVFPNGIRVAPAKPPRNADAPLYPPGNGAAFGATGDCAAGLVPFDIPATEHGAPAQVEFAHPSEPVLVWHVTSHDTDTLGTAREIPGGTVAVTGYSILTGRHRVATITVACADRPATWSLLLADGVTIASNPSGSHDCGGSIRFDLPASDRADPVEIDYNSGSTNLTWLMTPPTQ
jgi:Zn-dependent protease with chaperone function